MDIVKTFNFPLCTKTRVPVKTLVEQLGNDSKSKKIIENHIASMYLVSILNEQSIKIREYKDMDYSFRAIYVFHIELKMVEQMTEFTHLVHSAFPESTILLLTHKDTEYISAAYKRINKNDNTKTVIENSVWATLFEGFNPEFPSLKNLKEYYEYIVRMVYRIKVQNVAGVYPTIDGEYKKNIQQYELLSTNIKKLKEKYTSATMRNEKMRIDNELFEEEEKLNHLVNILKGA